MVEGFRLAANFDQIVDQRFADINFGSVLEYLTQSEVGPAWPITFAKETITWYTRFLYLRKLNPPCNLRPDKAIDIVWHAHLNNFKKYSSDCARAIECVPQHDEEHSWKFKSVDFGTMIALYFHNIYSEFQERARRIDANLAAPATCVTPQLA